MQGLQVNSRSSYNTVALLALVAATLACSRVHAAESAERTGKLVAVIQSDASLFEKARACQQLGEIGTREAVPALAELLSDPRLSAYARSGLENIPDPSAAAALRGAADKLKGPLLVGVVNSLGALRNSQAVPLLEKLAANPDTGVVKEALHALGNIASAESIRIVRQALSSGPDAFRDEAAAACLLAADHQRVAGNLAVASELYDAIRSAKVPTACRIGATRGAILSRKGDRVEFLIEQLRSDELAVRNAALLTIRDIPDETLASALNAELARANLELQCQLLLALVDCHNEESIPSVAALTSSQNPEVRKTALSVLSRLGPAAATELVGALLLEPAAADRTVIMDGLRSMPGSAVDDWLLKALGPEVPPAARIDLIRLLESRGVSRASDKLLQLAAGNDKEVSVASLSALKSLGGPAELPGLISLTRACREEALREAAESAIVGVCGRCTDEANGPGAVLNELRHATNADEKNSWIRILVSLGYAKALPIIEAAGTGPDEEVARNALKQLGRWPNAAPMETLLKVMETGASQDLRQRALVSVIDLAASVTDDAQIPQPRIVEWLKRADSAAQAVADKRRILGILGQLKTIESFRLLRPYMDNPELRTEAVVAIVQIAPALTKSNEASAVKTALEKIAATVPNEDIKTRAARVAKSIP